MPPVFLQHPSSFEHETGGHPEQPARLAAIDQELSERGWLGFERVRSPAVDRTVLTAVHPESHVEALERLCARGGGPIDLDTLASAGSCEAARHAAGGAVRMVEMLLDGEATFGFSAHRPPGHHATRTRAMGFCLFNNVAVAAQFALDHRGLERVMILDWDVHHGNGTNDIFHAVPEVLFFSIHQSPWYPGTGPAGDIGSGPGEGFTVNVPVPAGSGDDVFRSILDHVALPLLESFEPELVLVSAGYDAHRDDPLGACTLTEAGYAAMTRSIRRACRSADAPVGCVLEGGYGLGALARSVAATLAELGEAEPAEPREEVAITPLARQARERLAGRWPLLA